ncbi:MAG: SigB/SigF/SigG family RNA polymerase sigma factor [Acidimicrobiales bacterium]
MPDRSDSARDDEAWLSAALERFAEDRTDEGLRDQIFRRARWLAVRGARRFSDRGEPFDDLVQVASFGLLKAIERFEPSMGVPFGSYATPTILGELRRHFRDHTWSVRVPRRAKDLRASVNAASDELSRRLGRSPTIAEIAAQLELSEDAVLEVLEANNAYRSRPLDHATVADQVTVDDDADHVIDREMIVSLLEHLRPRERTILYLRYFEELSQAQIAERVGTSQVHVGRLIASSLTQLRTHLTTEFDDLAGDERGDERSDDVARLAPSDRGYRSRRPGRHEPPSRTTRSPSPSREEPMSQMTGTPTDTTDHADRAGSNGNGTGGSVTSTRQAVFTVPSLTLGQGADVAERLQQRLVALLDLGLTLKHIHWNVVGPHFIGVHEMLDPQYAGVQAMIDEIAERIATLGATPSGLPGRLVAQRTWDDYELDRADSIAHLGALDLVYQGVIADHREQISALDELDPVTQDLLIGQTAVLEKYHWFVRSHLENWAGGMSNAGAASEAGAAKAVAAKSHQPTGSHTARRGEG